jgi:hypothetical protein
MPVEVYTMLLTVRLCFGQHAKCCSTAVKYCVNASCCQMLKAKCHMHQIYFYETNKIPKVVIRLFNVWTELGSYRFNEINNYM